LLLLNKGMEEVNLYTFLKRCQSLVSHVFPTEAKRIVSSSVIKASFHYEEIELTEDQKRAVEYLYTYLDDAEGEEGNYVIAL